MDASFRRGLRLLDDPRVTACLKRAIRFPSTIYLDSFTFGVGRAQVALNTIGFGVQFPPAAEEGLYRVLASRTLAAGAAYPAIAG
jgi:hypothetical protein